MEQPSKLRKLTIEIRDDDTDSTIMGVVKAQVEQSKHHEELIKEFLQEHEKDVEAFKDAIRGHAWEFFKKLYANDHIATNLVQTGETLTNDYRKKLDMLPEEVWEMEPMNQCSYGSLLQPFKEHNTKKKAWMEILKRTLKIFEELPE